MVPQFKNILYATDLSENSRPAFLYAASLADQYQAKITVVHVIEEFNAATFMQIHSYFGEAQLAEIVEKRRQIVLDEVTSKLDEFCSELSNEMRECNLILDKITVRTGIPVNEILAQADESFADIILIGTHGYHLLKDAIMGGVARRIVRRSKVPVLVVRHESKE